MNITECNIVKANHIHRSHGEGKFYNMPDNFPFILHDKCGCIFIDEKIFNYFKEYGFLNISHSKNGDKINIVKVHNISQLKGYTKCECALQCPKAKFKK